MCGILRYIRCELGDDANTVALNRDDVVSRWVVKR